MISSRSYIRAIAVVASIATVAMAVAQRKPTVTYSVSGTSGNYTLDFNVHSNLLSGEGFIYFFGVKMSARDIAGSPTGWDPNAWSSWDNSPYGGSTTIYNNIWLGDSSGGSASIAPGATQGGFKVHTTDATAPTSVQFYAFAFSGTYGGNDNFNNQNNPGWEGNASPVPEPASMAVLGAGAVALLRRRRK